jgi:ankyrin repeat protein
MHVAAQADRAFPLTFLWYNGVDVDCVDSEGQTPLHWACYQGAGEAIYYLLAWSNSLNKQDNKGKTPLH